MKKAMTEEQNANKNKEDVGIVECLDVVPNIQVDEGIHVDENIHVDEGIQVDNTEGVEARVGEDIEPPAGVDTSLRGAEMLEWWVTLMAGELVEG